MTSLTTQRIIKRNRLHTAQINAFNALSAACPDTTMLWADWVERAPKNLSGPYRKAVAALKAYEQFLLDKGYAYRGVYGTILFH